ncbi:MAG: hypothetical protein CVU11_05330 [Bacteroidetes bacterium HGW-Bacteroidetes-6]|jgi:tetratricopeptide (TPR) repeat protein|nr:MAG: hypothetical protein CVU11_05330 [Bacteroidetes bacterium HGW-Bacteroidetes-6]
MRNCIAIFAIIVLTVFASCENPKRKAIDLKQEGIALMYQNKFNPAIEKFEKSLEYNDKDPETWYYIGNAWFGLKDVDKAFENYCKAIETDSTYGQAYINRGRIFKERGDHDAACSDWLTAEKLGIKTIREETKFCK